MLRSSQARHFAPSPTHEKRLSTEHGMCLWIASFCCRRKAFVLPPGQPLSSVSGRQRSNTLYFARKVCANRVLRAPIGNPAPRGFSPLDTPLFLTAKGYSNHQNRFGSRAVKNRKSEKSPRGGLKKFRIFVHGSLLRICKFPWRSCGGNEGEVADLSAAALIACFLKCKR